MRDRERAPAGAPVPAPTSSAAARPSRLPALDGVRVVTVVTVIAVHSLSVLLPEDGGPAGVALTVFHSSREVFLLLSALVLTYTAGPSPVALRRFWRRRFPLIVAPYVAWTVIYMLSDGDLGSVPSIAARLGFDLLTGQAHFHLYFVLLTFQLYLVFPWVLRWVRAREGRLVRTVAASLAIQLAFTTIAHFSLPVPPPLSWLAAHPGSWLFSYQLYVIAGIAVGLHIDQVTGWCSRHVHALAVVALATVAASVAWYVVELDVLRNGAVMASDVFQPVVVLESLAISAWELGACQRWTARAGAGAMTLLSRASDASFGIYLAHPIVLELAITTGLASALASLPPIAAVALVVLVAPPVLFAVVGLTVTWLRGTPLSLLVCGRPRRRPTPPAAGAVRQLPVLRPAAQAVPACSDRGVRVP